MLRASLGKSRKVSREAEAGTRVISGGNGIPVQSARRARAAVGRLVPGLVGDTEIYVSGGAKGKRHQEVVVYSLCVVYRTGSCRLAFG